MKQILQLENKNFSIALAPDQHHQFNLQNVTNYFASLFVDKFSKL